MFANSNDFYITLPSNASSDDFPENTLADFSVTLPTPLSLNGVGGGATDWEVALCEMIFPCAVYNVSKQDTASYWTYRVRGNSSDAPFTPWFHVNIVPGYYCTPNAVITSLNNSLPPHAAQTLAFGYWEAEHKCYIQNLTQESDKPVPVDVWFPARLALVLGFLPGHINSLPSGIAYPYKENQIKLVEGKNLMAPKPMDMSGGISLMYVYSNVCAPQIVGDVAVPLLRIIPLRHTFHQQKQCSEIKQAAGALPCASCLLPNELISVEYNTPHYVRVNHDEINHVRISINTDTGEKVPFFTSGVQGNRVVVKLHFRHCHPPWHGLRHS